MRSHQLRRASPESSPSWDSRVCNKIWWSSCSFSRDRFPLRAPGRMSEHGGKNNFRKGIVIDGATKIGTLHIIPSHARYENLWRLCRSHPLSPCTPRALLNITPDLCAFSPTQSSSNSTDVVFYLGFFLCLFIMKTKILKPQRSILSSHKSVFYDTAHIGWDRRKKPTRLIGHWVLEL